MCPDMVTYPAVLGGTEQQLHGVSCLVVSGEYNGSIGTTLWKYIIRCLI